MKPKRHKIEYLWVGSLTAILLVGGAYALFIGSFAWLAGICGGYIVLVQMVGLMVKRYYSRNQIGKDECPWKERVWKVGLDQSAFLSAGEGWEVERLEDGRRMMKLANTGEFGDWILRFEALDGEVVAWEQYYSSGYSMFSNSSQGVEGKKAKFMRSDKGLFD